MSKSREGGYTLMEVLAAIAMLAIAIDLAVSSYNTIFLSENRVRNFTKAHNVAIALLEQLMSNYATDANLTAGVHTLPYDVNGNVLAGPSGFFTASWTITSNTPITNIMQIQLYISWIENGNTRTVHFLTFRRS